MHTKLRRILDRPKGTDVPAETRNDTDPQGYLLSTVHQGQAAVIGTICTWTSIIEQLTPALRSPVPDVDLRGIVDRTFDLAEQTLAAQHQLARTLAGVATRQVAVAAETAATAVAAVEPTVGERLPRVEDLVAAAEAEREQPQASGQDRRPDGRTYEERSVEELRERAAELQIEGRSTMSKDELIAALRQHRQRRPARSDTPGSQPPKQERQADRRAYEERSIEELRERARELQIEGRSTMSKDELIAALRK
jgi:hypothetical protein